MTDVLDQKLQSCFAQLNETEKKSVLLLLKTFLGSRPKTANFINIEQYNKEIDEALAEAERGDYITQEEMENQATKW